MSGGRYNYAYGQIENLAYEISRNANTPERKAFVRLLLDAAKAARAIEWNDSGDDASDENELIRKALGNHWKQCCMTSLVEEASELCKTLQQYITNHRLTI